MELSQQILAFSKKSTFSPQSVLAAIHQSLKANLGEYPKALTPCASGLPTVILMVGVNGTGKTSSSAKLAHYLKNQGYTVSLAAADTFRAAAVEQLKSWADKLNIPIFCGEANADSSSVCYLAHQQAIEKQYQFLICDTAGRLHTKHNLMEELKKINRTLSKQDPNAPHYQLLVIDATTGSNALIQAKNFHKTNPLDGIILTKLDGSAKGGVAIRIQKELGLLPLFIGTGEEASDFKPFDPNLFVEEMV